MIYFFEVYFWHSGNSGKSDHSPGREEFWLPARWLNQEERSRRSQEEGGSGRRVNDLGSRSQAGRVGCRRLHARVDRSVS